MGTYHILVLILEGVFAHVVTELFAVVDDDNLLLENLNEFDITVLRAAADDCICNFRDGDISDDIVVIVSFSWIQFARGPLESSSDCAFLPYCNFLLESRVEMWCLGMLALIHVMMAGQYTSNGESSKSQEGCW